MEQTNQTDTATQAVAPIRSTSALFGTLMALVENYINDIVQKQVSEIMLNHSTMRVIDDGFERKIRDIAEDVVEDAISNHNDGEYHISESDIDDTVSTAINDYDFDDKVNDAVTSAIDQLDLTEMIRTEIKDNISFSVSVD
jgi:C1A family cysteine protease